MGDQIQNSINVAIDTIIKNRINTLALDKTVIGIIDSIKDPIMNIYKVKYDGGYFNAKCEQTDAVYRSGMSVYVLIPQNDMTKEKKIIGRAYAQKGSELANSVISAINSYSIMGGNLLQTTENKLPEQFGLHSYHDKAKENDSDPITHRAQSLYGDIISSTDYYDIDYNSLDIYKESATGLMVEADFRTALSTEQKNQYNGSYGIIFDIIFENSAYEYGETNKEIFDYFAPDIETETTILNPDFVENQRIYHDVYLPERELLAERYQNDEEGWETALAELNAEYANLFDNSEENIANKEYIKIIKSVADYAEAFCRDIAYDGKNPQGKIQDLLKTDGLIDMYISYIQAITDSYATANPQLFTSDADEIINSFIQLLKDIKAIYTEQNTLADIFNEYKAWANLAVAPPAEKKISYILDSDHMVGSPYYFTSWSTQYEIFNIDFSTFKRIENIVFYKDGFIADSDKDNRIGEDIFVKNLKIYALQPISAINGEYSLKLNAPDGFIFPREIAENEESITLKAQVFKQYSVNLSDQVVFQWFKSSPAITSVGYDDYRPYGGLGWKYLERKGTKKNFTITRAENPCYANKYKCVAIIDSTVVLSQEFTIYNEAVSDNIVINSDMGTHFTFDVGSPILTALFYKRPKLENTEENKEITYEERIPIPTDEENLWKGYTYTWAIVINEQRTFLDGQKIDMPAYSKDQDIVSSQNLQKLIRGVQFYQGDTLITDPANTKYATRIQYPVRNIAFESGATFECYIQNNGAEIGSASIVLFNQTQGAAVDYRISIENGEQIFQYDEYGGPPNDEKLKSPQEIKPLVCHFFNPTGLEVGNSNYKVEWIIPIEDTLVTTNVALQTNPLNNYVFEIDPNQQCIFNIAQLYDESCQNNQITCRVTYNEQVFEKTTNMFFGKVGSNGTNGTDMVLKIEPSLSIPILSKEPLTLYRSEFNSELGEYQVLTLNDGTIVRKDANDWELPLSASEEGVNHLRARLFQKNDEIPISVETVRWNVAGSTKSTLNNIGKYLKANSGKLIWREDFQKKKRDNFIIRAWITYLEKDYYAFYNLPVIEYVGMLPRVSRVSIDKKFLLKDIIYNADGRNPIYSHTQGVKINNIPAGGYVTWEAIGGQDDNQRDCFFSLLEDKDSNQGLKEILPIWRNLETDEIVTEFTEEITENDCYKVYPPEKVYILPNDEYDGGYCNNRVVAKIYKNDNSLLATVTVPIHMSLNTFGLASLNAWDGTSVTVDEEGGYIMAPQIGAGEKDNNNRFTGIVMGKTETYTGSSAKEKQTGLLGYSHGLQSIFLDAETGEATFGLPGGKILTENGNTLIPTNVEVNGQEDYGEGRVELRPGGISKIGGWQFGKRSLYYTAEGSTITDRYRYSGKLLEGGYKDKDSARHVKDIRHDEQGILISADPPYMSIKGRTLTVDDFKDVDTENRQVFEGESLELQLDPDNIAMFAIYRHFKNVAKDNAWDREMISGINAKGQLVANKMQQVPIDDSSAASSTLGIDALTAFEGPNYIGLNLTAGANSINSNLSTFFRAFVNQDDIKGIGSKSASETPLYITGGQFGSKAQPNDYSRPISIHGKTVSLWASNNASNGPTTDNYMYVGNNEGFIGIKNLGTSYYWTRKDGVAIPGTPVYNVYDLYDKEQWWFDKETGDRVFPRQFNFDNDSLWKQYKLYINQETGEEIIKEPNDIPPIGFPYKIRKTGLGDMDYEYVLDNNGERIRIWISHLIYKDLTITDRDIYWYEKITYIWESDNQEHDNPPSTGEYEILRMYWSYPDGDSEYPPEAYYNLYTLKIMYVRNNKRSNITGLPASTENPIEGWNRVAKVNGTYNRSNSSFLFINQRISDPGDEIPGSLLHTSNRLDIQSNSGIINIIARGAGTSTATDTRQITLQVNDSTNSQTPLTKLELINASSSENDGIVASTQGKASLTAGGNIELIRNTNSYLKIQGDTIDLRTTNDNNRLYLKNASGTHSSLTTTGDLDIVSNNNTITIETKKAAAGSPAIYLSAHTATSGTENYLKMWSRVGSASTDNLTLFELNPAGFNPIKYTSGLKPSVKDTSVAAWKQNNTYGYETSALVIGETTDNSLYGGLRSSWAYITGQIHGAQSNTGNKNLVQTGLYVLNRIASANDVLANADTDDSVVSLYNHTHPFSLAVTLSSASGGATMTGTGKWTIKANIKDTCSYTASSHTSCTHKVDEDSIKMEISFKTTFEQQDYYPKTITQSDLGQVYYQKGQTTTLERSGQMTLTPDADKWSDQVHIWVRSASASLDGNGCSYSPSHYTRGAPSFDAGPHTLSGTSGSPNHNMSHVNNSSPNYS